jgi:hypothetical protein
MLTFRRTTVSELKRKCGSGLIPVPGGLRGVKLSLLEGNT